LFWLFGGAKRGAAGRAETGRQFGKQAKAK
jgi:hypothetical protein